MAASYGSGGQSPPVLGRPVERVLEEAQFTGDVNLSGRKLKDYPKICSKYELVDTIHTDLSKNRLMEVPPEVCEYSSMESLNCYHNIIKSIPDAIVQLQALTHLNLSRNQLTVLPVSLCLLSSLEVLSASNNKLVSLPEEIGKLERLMDLDVSCNEISHLPPHIGDLGSLRSLNLRRNLLVELPLDICKLNLRRLDISSNRIERIPTIFRKLEMLEEINLEHNPLTTPPAHICTRGRQHIMKYLQTEAIKEERRRGIPIDSDMKRLIRKSLPPQQTSDEFRNMLESPESKWKRHTVLSSDSGYSTAESLDKCGWNHSETVGDIDENSVLAIKAAEAVREQRQGRDGHVHNSVHIISESSRLTSGPLPPSPTSNSVQLAGSLNGSGQSFNGPLGNHQAPPSPSPSPSPVGALLTSSNRDKDFAQELQRQKLEYEQRKKVAEQIRIQHELEEKELEERRRAALKLQEEQRALIEKQREDHKREMERKQQEEQIRFQEQQRLLEEQALQEEEARLREASSRVHEEMISQEAERGRTEEKVHDEGGRNKTANKNALSSQSLKEQRRITNTQQYRRTTSDGIRRGIPTAINNTHVDSLNHINKNGIIDDTISDQNLNPPSSLPISTNTSSSSKPTSPTSAKPGVARLQAGERAPPSQSPVVRRSKGNERSNVPLPSSGRSVSRTSSTSSVNSIQSQGSAGRTTATTSTSATTTTASRTKNHMTPESDNKEKENNGNEPQEEEFKQKHQQVKSQHQTESHRLKSRLEEQRRGATEAEDRRRAPQSRAGATTGNKGTPRSDQRHHQNNTRIAGSTGKHPPGAMKMLEEYKDSNPNFTIRRRDELHKEENQQIEMLRQTIESRLKVTLPDNLPEALRDGVVLCHLANQIRPRSVASIHVPSPAVPKLTLAKCRRNVDNFLDACKKIGVEQEQICQAADIMDERGVNRVAITVAALVAIGTNPRQSAV